MIAEVIHKQGRWCLVVSGFYLLIEGDTIRDPNFDGRYWTGDGLKLLAEMMNERKEALSVIIPEGGPDIDWSKAPEWANYHAFDADYEGAWFEKVPVQRRHFWEAWGQRRVSGYEKLDSIDWRITLVKRPAGEAGE